MDAKLRKRRRLTRSLTRQFYARAGLIFPTADKISMLYSVDGLHHLS
jgi:hypothetical protein